MKIYVFRYIRFASKSCDSEGRHVLRDAAKQPTTITGVKKVSSTAAAPLQINTRGADIVIDDTVFISGTGVTSAACFRSDLPNYTAVLINDGIQLKPSSTVKEYTSISRAEFDKNSYTYGDVMTLSIDAIVTGGAPLAGESVYIIAGDMGTQLTSAVLDSEDICFIPDGNYKKFLENNSNIKPEAGDIVTSDGEVLGKHNGLYNYTIGQRKGLGISYKEPLYVIGFNKEKNEVIVGEENEIYSKEMLVNNINLLLIDEIKEKMQVLVKTRYSVKEEKATIEMIDKDLIKVTFEKPTPRITPGQSAVFYIDDIVLGGGKIVKAFCKVLDNN